MDQTCAIILAAGEGRRMQSQRPKVLTEVLFKPMIKWVLDALIGSGILDICVVIGFGRDVLEGYLRALPFACKTCYQAQRKGTAHAVMAAIAFLKENRAEDVLVLSGDSPFLNSDLIKNSYLFHKEQKNAATLISAKIANPFGYGRILRDREKLVGIVEQKDASDEQKLVNEVNSGTYWFKLESLISILPSIKNNNSQKEFYLTDAIRLLAEQKESLSAYVSPETKAVLGANNQAQLCVLNRIARKQILKKWIDFGTEIPCKDGIIIGPDVIIGNSCRILPGTIIQGETKIGENCEIGPNTNLKNCSVGKGSVLAHVYCENKVIEDFSRPPPFSQATN